MTNQESPNDQTTRDLCPLPSCHPAPNSAPLQKPGPLVAAASSRIHVRVQVLFTHECSSFLMEAMIHAWMLDLAIQNSAKSHIPG